MNGAWPTFDGEVKPGKTFKNLSPLCHVRTSEQSDSIIPGRAAAWQYVKHVWLTRCHPAVVEKTPSHPFAYARHAASDENQILNRSQQTAHRGAGCRTFAMPKRCASNDDERGLGWKFGEQCCRVLVKGEVRLLEAHTGLNAQAQRPPPAAALVGRVVMTKVREQCRAGSGKQEIHRRATPGKSRRTR